MRKLFLIVFTAVALAWSASAFAALPYYNKDLGYTIWLADEWVEAPETYLSRYNDFYDGVACDDVGWEAGYKLDGASTSLLVSEIHGRVVSKASIGNFNRHVVREVIHGTNSMQDWQERGRIYLKKASFDAEKNILRLEMDKSRPDGQSMTTLVYIVYTANGMLKFVGLVEPGDIGGVNALDQAVASLYLDYGLRQ